MYRPSVDEEKEASLPEELLPLRELLAARVHDAWAAGRLADGWRYGPVRDDAAKTHPDLVPYEELPEEEKAYDRRTATVSVRFILDSGYRIEKIGAERE